MRMNNSRNKQHACAPEWSNFRRTTQPFVCQQLPLLYRIILFNKRLRSIHTDLIGLSKKEIKNRNEFAFVASITYMTHEINFLCVNLFYWQFNYSNHIPK